MGGMKYKISFWGVIGFIPFCSAFLARPHIYSSNYWSASEQCDGWLSNSSVCIHSYNDIFAQIFILCNYYYACLSIHQSRGFFFFYIVKEMEPPRNGWKGKEKQVRGWTNNCGGGCSVPACRGKKVFQAFTERGQYPVAQSGVRYNGCEKHLQKDSTIVIMAS